MIKTLSGIVVFRAVLAAGIAALGGCVVYDPYYPYYGAPGGGTAAAYDRSWGAAVGAIRDQNIQITKEDRSAGVIEGQRGGLTMKARVITQADGRIRVEFNTGGNLAEDPGLSDRISRSYDARMGRGS